MLDIPTTLLAASLVRDQAASRWDSASLALLATSPALTLVSSHPEVLLVAFVSLLASMMCDQRARGLTATGAALRSQFERSVRDASPDTQRLSLSNSLRDDAARYIRRHPDLSVDKWYSMVDGQSISDQKIRLAYSLVIGAASRKMYFVLLTGLAATFGLGWILGILWVSDDHEALGALATVQTVCLLLIRRGIENLQISRGRLRAAHAVTKPGCSIETAQSITDAVRAQRTIVPSWFYGMVRGRAEQAWQLWKTTYLIS